jgi:hypothetical protein
VQYRVAISDPTRWGREDGCMHVPCFSNAVLLADLATVSLHRCVACPSHTEPEKLMAKRRQRNPFLFYTSPRREKREIFRWEGDEREACRRRAGGVWISFWVETEESTAELGPVARLSGFTSLQSCRATYTPVTPVPKATSLKSSAPAHLTLG